MIHLQAEEISTVPIERTIGQLILNTEISNSKTMAKIESLLNQLERINQTLRSEYYEKFVWMAEQRDQQAEIRKGNFQIVSCICTARDD